MPAVRFAAWALRTVNADEPLELLAGPLEEELATAALMLLESNEPQSEHCSNVVGKEIQEKRVKIVCA